MPIDHQQDQNPPHTLSDASDVLGDRGGHRHEVGAGAGHFGSARTRIARALAQEGYGIDDVMYKMNLDREWRATVADIVLRRIK